MSQEDAIQVDDGTDEEEIRHDNTDPDFEDVDGEDDESEDETGEEESGGSAQGDGSAEGGGSAGGACEGATPSKVCGARLKREHEKSDVWKYFKPVEGDATVAVCLLCQKTLKTGGGTSNQRAHICRVHAKIAIDDGLIETKRTTQSSLDGHLVVAPGYVKQAVKWIVMGYLPLQACELEAYRDMVRSISPKVHCPSRGTVGRELARMEAESRRQASTLLRDVYFSATTDIWTGANKKAFISLIVSFIDRDPARASWQLRTLDLECSPFPEDHNGVNIAIKIIKLMKTAGLDLTKCINITTDNASNMLKAAEHPDMPDRQACAVHTIELTVKRLVGSAPVKGAEEVGADAEGGPARGRGNLSAGSAELQTVLKDCSAVVSFYSRSPKATEALETMSRLTPRGKLISLKSAVKTRWWTELTMLDSLLANEDIFVSMVTLDKAPAAVKKLNWPRMKTMGHVLRPFADCVKMLEGDKYVTGALVASSLCYLRKAIVAMLNNPDKATAGAAKSMLQDFDQRWCFDLAVNASGKAGLSKTHLICACLDPRTKGLAHFPAALKVAARQTLEEALQALTVSKVQERRQVDIDAGLKELASGSDAVSAPQDCSEETKAEVAGDPKPKSLVRMILEPSGDEDSELEELEEWSHYDTAPSRNDEYTHLQQQYDAEVNSELIKFKRVAPLPADKDPLEWWTANKGQFPMMSEMAARYLCSSASSASSERLFSKAGLTMSKKRMSLTGDNLARIITVRGAITSGLLDAYFKP